MIAKKDNDPQFVEIALRVSDGLTNIWRRIITPEAIAEHFDSPDDLRDADRNDLEEIHGVGPSLSEAIVGEFEE